MQTQFARLTRLYGAATAQTLWLRLDALREKYRGKIPAPRAPLDQRAALLITYGDQLRAANETPLQTLAQFLDAHAREIL
ncbi:sugar phosphorylase, partial [Anaerolineae bacterium CFX7]|nr:sugar phosphorylase [Anaerolineae bacterium CFX7]